MNWETITDHVPHEWKPAAYIGVFVATISASGFAYLFNTKADETHVLTREAFYEEMKEFRQEMKHDHQRLEDQLREKQDKP